jgi:glycopeptide antibiotics resistance protein
MNCSVSMPQVAASFFSFSNSCGGMLMFMFFVLVKKRSTRFFYEVNSIQAPPLALVLNFLLQGFLHRNSHSNFVATALIWHDAF